MRVPSSRRLRRSCGTQCADRTGALEDCRPVPVKMSRRWAVGIAAFAFAACATAPPGFQGDARLSAAARAAPERLIVVTVVNDPPALESRAGSTPRAYRGFERYGVGTGARDIGAALARSYGLKEVAAWPIAVLQMHCIVFQIPPNASRAAILARLQREDRVKLAEPLNTFHSMTHKLSR